MLRFTNTHTDIPGLQAHRVQTNADTHCLQSDTHVHTHIHTLAQGAALTVNLLSSSYKKPHNIKFQFIEVSDRSASDSEVILRHIDIFLSATQKRTTDGFIWPFQFEPLH